MAEFVQYGGTNGGTYAGKFTGKLIVWEISYDINSNTSNVGYRLELISGNSGRFSDLSANYAVSIDGSVVRSGSGRYSSQSYNTAQTICEGTVTVYHNADGSKNIGCWASLDFQSHTYSPGDFSPSGYMDLTTIPRYAGFNSHRINAKTSTSVDIAYNSNKNLVAAESSLNGGAWTPLTIVSGTWNQANNTVIYRLSNLTPNMQYRIQTRIAHVNGLWTSSDTLTVTTYAKTTPTLQLTSKSVNSIEVNSSCNVAVSSTKYRIKKSNSEYGPYQDSNLFSNLEYNTSYVIEVQMLATDSKEYGYATLDVKTEDIARLTSYPNFNLGDIEKIVYTNPQNAELYASIYNENNTSSICAYRKISATSYTFNFTDTELDNFYKLYGNNNTIKVRLIINTRCNGLNYYDYKIVTVTLTGNQKTGYNNINGSWKRSKRWININGVWKRRVRWINDNGIWKRCI